LSFCFNIRLQKMRRAQWACKAFSALAKVRNNFTGAAVLMSFYQHNHSSSRKAVGVHPVKVGTGANALGVESDRVFPCRPYFID